jgi:uncharacterized protein (DUF1800 family)
MKAVCRAVGVSAFLMVSLALAGRASGPFGQKLSTDKQVAHVLNRLAFGPRPGDVAYVRRLGVGKWVDLQLHPDRIAENPVLDAKTRALKTPAAPTWALLANYSVTPPVLNSRSPSSLALASLPPQQASRIMNGSLEERRTTLAALDPGVRRLVLAAAPARVLDGLSEEWLQDAANVRRTEQDDRQKELRRLMPPLTDLLSPQQMNVAMRGKAAEKRALIDGLGAEPRRQLLRAMPVQALVDLPDLRREAMALSQPQQFVNAELMEQKLYRAIYSNRQLEEVLVDFWTNHFNVFNGKGPDRVLLTSFERDAIRPYVFGHFKDMLLATARHPAMLYYLDNWQSQAPREDLPPPPQGARRPGLNENYGRELMELHTLGVDGGYTQADVVAVARAFTGWTIYDPQRFAEFQFNPAVHDRKEKVVLGHTIPAMGGEQDGLEVIDILAHHPSTARFISRKLAQRFVADAPPPALVDRMAATFTRTDGDLRAVVETMVTSPEFLSEGAWRAKVKSPLELVVSSIRATDAEVIDTFSLAQRIADLGQPLYGKLEPTGYSNTGDAWTNTASILGRINFEAALAAGQVPGVSVPTGRFASKPAAVVAAELLDFAPPATLVAAIEKGLQGRESTPALLLPLVMSSPDFQRR